MAEAEAAVADAPQDNKTPDSNPADDGGLLNSESPDSPVEDKNLDTAATNIEHRADTDINANERPPWLPEKYKTPEDFRKGFDELLTAFSQGKHKAPKDGKYDMSAFGENVSAEDPALKVFTGWAQKHGLSQEAFSEFSKSFMELASSLADPSDDPVAYREAETKKLGEHAQALIKGAADWGRSLINRGILSRDDWDEYRAMAGSAGGVRILLKMRELIEGPLPVNQSAPIEGLPSREELEAMVGDKRYETDPAYRRKVEDLFKKAFPE